MPRLPDENSLGQRPATQGRRQFARYNPGQVEQATQNLASTVFDISQGFQEREDRQNYAKAKSLLAQEQIAASHDFDNDSDYHTFESRYTDRMDKARSDAAAMITHAGLRSQFMTDTDLAIQRGTFQIQEKALARERDHGLSVLTTTLDTNREMGLTATDPDERAAILNANSLAIDTAVENGYMDELKGTQLKKKVAVDYSVAFVGMKDPAEQLTLLNDKNNPMIKMIPADKKVDMIRRAEIQIELQKEKALHATKLIDKERVSDTILAYSQGQSVSKDDYKAALKSAQRLGSTEDLVIAKSASEFILLPKEQRDALLPKVEGVDMAEMRQALEKASDIIDTELKKDGYAFAVKQGVVDEAPLDLDDPETIQARLAQVDYLKSHYGKSISPLTEDEAEVLIESLDRMSPQDKSLLATAFGPSTAIWQQLDKKNAGLFAMVGAIGDRQVMQDVFKGQQRIKEKLVAPIKLNDYLPVFDDYVSNVYSGKDRRSILNAAVAHYYALTESEDFDSGDFEDSIEAVTGGIGQINGRKVELPRGVDEEDLDDFVDNISPETVEAFGGVWSMSSKEAAKLIQDSQLISIGANRYNVSPDGFSLLKTPNGEDFVLSFDRGLFEADKNVRMKRRGEMTPLARER